MAFNRFLHTLSAVLVLVFCTAASVHASITYKKVPYGFNKCKVEFDSLHRDVTLAQMKEMANKVGADGFTYQPTLRYGRVLKSPYDRTCQSPANESWPLYLTEKYAKMPYGFNRCKVNFGPLQSGVTLAHMRNTAAKSGADGFTYHPTLLAGRVLRSPYDRACQSPANQSWPLYLSVVYAEVPYGFNGCKVDFGPLQRNVNVADMIKLAAKAGADGFTYQSSLRYGNVLKKPYDRACQSPPNQSWPLYLVQH